MTTDNQNVVRTKFLEDVSRHTMHRMHDEGMFRVVRFARPGSSVYAFTVVTWPGYLAVTGDMGDYVFSRVPDMFTFFRSTDEALRINPSYWHEKMVAEGRERAKEFSKDQMLSFIQEEFDSWRGRWQPSPDAIAEAQDSLELYVLKPLKDDGYGLEGACRLLYEFPCNKTGDFSLHDTTDWPSFQDYTYHFLWCLYAIVWGIQQYDRNTEVENASDRKKEKDKEGL